MADAVSAPSCVGGEDEIYWECQKRQFCLKHALNVLWGFSKFTPDDLNVIADIMEKPGLFMSSKRVKFFGNYDVELMMRICLENGVDVSYSKESTLLDDIKDNCLGIIINVPAGGFFGRVLGSRHWYLMKSVVLF